MSWLADAVLPPPVKVALVAGPYAAAGALALLCWHFDSRAVANADAMRAQAAQFKAAQATANQRAQQALMREQALYQTRAVETDRAYQNQLAAARLGSRAYVDSHRVQFGTVAGRGSAAAASAESNRTGVSANLPADPVMVSASDVQICSDAVTYGLQAHNWALTFIP